eukprot:654635-Pleurochrysis_carterae.AAC.1
MAHNAKRLQVAAVALTTARKHRHDVVSVPAVALVQSAWRAQPLRQRRLRSKVRCEGPVEECDAVDAAVLADAGVVRGNKTARGGSAAARGEGCVARTAAKELGEAATCERRRSGRGGVGRAGGCDGGGGGRGGGGGNGGGGDRWGDGGGGSGVVDGIMISRSGGWVSAALRSLETRVASSRHGLVLTVCTSRAAAYVGSTTASLVERAERNALNTAEAANLVFRVIGDGSGA